MPGCGNKMSLGTLIVGGTRPASPAKSPSCRPGALIRRILLVHNVNCSVCAVTLSRQDAGVPPGAPAWCRLAVAGHGGGLRWAWGILDVGDFT